MTFSQGRQKQEVFLKRSGSARVCDAHGTIVPPRGTKPSVYKLWAGRRFVSVGIMSAKFAGKFATSGDNVQAPSASNGGGIEDRIGDNMQALIDEVIGERKRKRDNKMEL